MPEESLADRVMIPPHRKVIIGGETHTITEPRMAGLWALRGLLSRLLPRLQELQDAGTAGDDQAALAIFLAVLPEDFSEVSGIVSRLTGIAAAKIDAATPTEFAGLVSAIWQLLPLDALRSDFFARAQTAGAEATGPPAASQTTSGLPSSSPDSGAATASASASSGDGP